MQIKESMNNLKSLFYDNKNKNAFDMIILALSELVNFREGEVKVASLSIIDNKDLQQVNISFSLHFIKKNINWKYIIPIPYKFIESSNILAGTNITMYDIVSQSIKLIILISFVEKGLFKFIVDKPDIMEYYIPGISECIDDPKKFGKEPYNKRIKALITKIVTKAIMLTEPSRFANKGMLYYDNIIAYELMHAHINEYDENKNYSSIDIILKQLNNEIYDIFGVYITSFGL